MKRINKITFALLLVLISSLVNSQALFTNDDLLLYIESGSLLKVEGDIVFEANAVSDNSGAIELDNDWVNNTLNYIFLNNSPGIVRMTGLTQSIRGTTLTQFHNLRLENLSAKSLFVDAWVDSILDLQDGELRVNNNTMLVRNPNQNSVQWDRGFVSGDSLGGYLARSTNRNSTYMFPVGNFNLNGTYRAVEVIPSTSDSSVYAVRLAVIDPELDFTGTSYAGSIGPFSRSALGPKIYGINDKFYHNISRFYASNTNQTLNTKIFYFNSDEVFPYEFNGVSYWSRSNLQWEIDNFGSNSAGFLPFIGIPDKFMRGVIANFTNDVYALTVKDKVIANVPQIFSPNSDGLNDFLYVYGDGIQDLEFVIYNRWGEKVFETKDQTIGWNGMFRGKKAQPGVYVYYLKASLNTSENIETSGDITLVR